MQNSERKPHLGPWDVIDAAGVVVATFDTKAQAMEWGNQNMPGEYDSSTSGEPNGWSLQIPDAEILDGDTPFCSRSSHYS